MADYKNMTAIEALREHDRAFQRVGADQVRPRHRAEQPDARKPAGFAAVRVDNPTKGPQFRTVRRAVAQA